MNARLRPSFLAIFPVVVLGLCLYSFGQSENAVISGTVSDSKGSLVSDATVVLTDIDTGISETAISDSDGLFLFTTVRAGEYRMTVEKEGFRRVVLTDFTVHVQDLLSRNFILQEGFDGHSVTVSGDTAQLDFRSPAVSTVVDQRFVANMPLNGRSFQSLIQLAPGVIVVPTDPSAQGQFSVNGQRSNANYVMVDGVSANFGMTPASNVGHALGGTTIGKTVGGGTNGLVSVDAMQEFRIQTTSYAPEFGRAPGANLSIVSKAGKNLFHGTAYDYLRNELFDARNYFNTKDEPKPELRQNDFGGTLSGPVLRNRTFFFFSYEGLRLAQPKTASNYFYTREARDAVAEAFKPLVNAFPLPDGPLLDATCNNVTNPCLAKLTESYSDPSSFDAFSFRLDHSLNLRIALFGRYSYTPSEMATRVWPGVSVVSTNNYTATFGAKIAITPNLVNNLRANWSRSATKDKTVLDNFHGAVVPPDSSLFRTGYGPDVAQTTVLFLQFQTLTAGTASRNSQSQFNFVDSLSLVRGPHLFKFGGDFRRMKPTGVGRNAPVNTVVFNFQSLTSGTVRFGSPYTSEPITVATNNISLFVQDTWRTTSRLTLTYGLRWDLNTPPNSATSEKPLYPIVGIFDSSTLAVGTPGAPLYHTNYLDFSPRFGAAYQLSPSTVMRGGFGIFYDLGYPMLLGQMLGGFPYSRSATNIGGAVFDPNGPLFAPVPFSTDLSRAFKVRPIAIDPNLKSPFSYQWSASVEQDLGNMQSVKLSYIAANGERLLRNAVIVRPDVLNSFAVGLNGEVSRYNALQLQYFRRMNNGLQALASYSFAHSNDTGSNDYDDIDSSYATTVSALQLPPLSRSDFDIRHNFSAAVSYEIPRPRLGSLGSALLSNWVLDGIERMSSGPPINVRIGGYSPDLFTYRTNPDLVPGQPIWLSAPTQPGGKVLNPDAFTLPANGPPGNFKRNSIQSPFGIAQTDLAIQRRFALGERFQLDFRVEFFNLFNHPMFGGPNAPDTYWGLCDTTPCTSTDTFGKVSSSDGTLNVGLGGGGLNGGQSALYAIGGPRSTQFTLKLSF